MQLANSLQGIVTQTLLPTADGTGRVAALEILLLDDAIRNLIRQGKIEQVYSYMQTGTRRGMQTMEQSLTELVQNRTHHRHRSGQPLEPARGTRLGAGACGCTDPRHVQRRRTCRHARYRRGAAGGRELAAHALESPERLLAAAQSPAPPPTCPPGSTRLARATQSAPARTALRSASAIPASAWPAPASSRAGARSASRPPADEPRYRTELSFKRHHSVPAASTGPEGPADAAPSPWLTQSSASDSLSPCRATTIVRRPDGGRRDHDGRREGAVLQA